MAANMKEIKARINSIKNSSQITNAMNIVSSTKFKKYQALTLKARDYANTLEDLLHNLLDSLGNYNHILFNGKKVVKKVGIIIMTSDRGLCGGFNSNAIKKLEKLTSEFKKQNKEVSIITVGRKAADYARNVNLEVDSEYTQLIPELMFEKAKNISSDIVDYYLSDFYDEVYLIYSKFNSIISYELQVEKLLPFFINKDDKKILTNEDSQKKSKKKIDFLFDPSKEDVLVDFIPQMLNVKIYQSMLENTSSEHSARMTAMKNASDNAKDLISHLTLEYNRVRQAIITQELTEIVGGAEALK